MPLKAGSSHALSAFFAVFFGYILKSYLDAHSEELRIATDFVGRVIIDVLASTFGVRLPQVFAGMLTVTVCIAFVWGISYHVVRHG